jgi:low affinity Fe/Cu permease
MSAAKALAHSAQNPASPATPGIGTRRDIFGQIAAWTVRMTGSRWAFAIALGSVLAWAVSGPFFHYSEMWQLVINTATTIVTFLMVFLIQNVQNRESKDIHLKLDELIRALERARNELIDIECLTEEQLDRLSERYSRIAARHQERLARRLECGES